MLASSDAPAAACAWGYLANVLVSPLDMSLAFDLRVSHVVIGSTSGCAGRAGWGTAISSRRRLRATATTSLRE
jgi:hypothetical protein